VPPPIARR
jgi:hypothetical protein